ncbi:hypothetical protein BH11GEM2_BH11GEM2_07610 [soil metagenome]
MHKWAMSNPSRFRPVLPCVVLAVRPFAVAWGTACVLATALHGQQKTVGAELWGRVLLAGDTVALPGTIVEVVGLSARTTSSQTGFYRFAQLPPGPQQLRVRRIGYESASIPVELKDGEAERRDISLVRLTATLTEVRIEGQVRKVPPRFQDVYRRMSTATGKFFTREDIDLLNPLDIQSLLDHVPTARVSRTGIKFARCNEAGQLALSPSGGKVQIWIDGNRMTGRLTTPRGTKDEDAIAAEQREVLKMVSPSQIQAIEVYSGNSRIPGEFLDDACAVIAIWTKSY